MADHPDRFESGPPIDPSDDEFDRLVREQLSGPSWPDDAAEQVLAALQPRLARARLVRRVQLATAATVPLLIIVAGLAVLVDQSSHADRGVTVAGQPDDASGAVADRPAETGPALAVTGTTVGDGRPPTTAGEAERASGGGATAVEPGDGPDEPGASVPPTASSTNPPPPASPSTTAPTAPSRPPTTDSPSTQGSGPTSSSVPGSAEITSTCGSIIVRAIGASVELLDTVPDPGYRVEVGNDGPEVEVSFERRDDECEIHAKVEDGGLVITGGELV